MSYAGHSFGDMKMMGCVGVVDKIGAWIPLKIRGILYNLVYLFESV